MDKVTAYKMTKTMDMANIKDLAGQTIKVDEIKVSHYTAPDGTEHTVLAILTDAGQMYRTETRAFIDDMVNFMEAFEDKADRPAITIATATSKRGNSFVKFTLE